MKMPWFDNAQMTDADNNPEGIYYSSLLGSLSY